jgi:hypothetical protein
MRALIALIMAAGSTTLGASQTLPDGTRYQPITVPSASISTDSGAQVASHYAVFEIDQAGNVNPVFYREVMLEPGFSLAAFSEEANDQKQADQVMITPEREGRRATASYAINVPSEWHGEFARDAEKGDFSIQAHHFRAPHRSFVVRAALTEFDVLNVVADGRVQRIDMLDVARSAEQLPLAAYMRNLQVQELDSQGRAASRGAPDSANRADLVVLGDGYTAAEQSTYFTHFNNLEQEFFNLTPLREYRGFVNWRPLFTASAQSGADHPPYQAGCTTTACCADTAAQSDPRAGLIVNTAFDARFCTAQIHRLLVVDTTKAQAAAVNAPNWDKLVVMVNDPVYGGSGGAIATSSVGASASQIMIHEYGHSFTTLADEYSSAFPGFPSCSDAAGSTALCEANVTNITDPAQIKWRDRFTLGVPIPTPAGNSALGLFQGARYLTSGMYRPWDNCMMRSLNRPFCSVCTDAYLRKLYRGGFGVPSNGISLIEPGSASPPSNAGYIFEVGQTVTFFVRVMTPNSQLPQIRWYYNDVLIPNATSNGMQMTFTGTASFQQLRVEVEDPSPLLLPADRAATKKTAGWVIQVNASLFTNGFEGFGFP